MPGKLGYSCGTCKRKFATRNGLSLHWHYRDANPWVCNWVKMWFELCDESLKKQNVEGAHWSAFDLWLKNWVHEHPEDDEMDSIDLVDKYVADQRINAFQDREEI